MFDDLVRLLQNKELVCRACGYREVHVLFPIYSESDPILAIVSAIFGTAKLKVGTNENGSACGRWLSNSI